MKEGWIDIKGHFLEKEGYEEHFKMVKDDPQFFGLTRDDVETADMWDIVNMTLLKGCIRVQTFGGVLCFGIVKQTKAPKTLLNTVIDKEEQFLGCKGYWLYVYNKVPLDEFNSRDFDEGLQFKSIDELILYLADNF